MRPRFAGFLIVVGGWAVEWANVAGRLSCGATIAYRPGKSIEGAAMHIGVAGLGAMGGNVAARLMEVGHQVTVWNRSPEKTKALADAGAKVAATPAAVAAASEAVITMLTDGAAIDAVYNGPSGLLSGDVKGKLFIEMSTVAPLARTLGASSVSTLGATVLISMNSLPLTSPDSSPDGPLYTASIAAPSVSMVMTASLAAATAAGVAATLAPASASALVFSGERFQTVTWWPTSISRAATLPPMAPRPATPICMAAPSMLLP